MVISEHINYNEEESAKLSHTASKTMHIEKRFPETRLFTAEQFPLSCMEPCYKNPGYVPEND